MWDCEPFLKEKKSDFFLDKKDYYRTGGRFSQGKNSDNIDFISLESKYGFCEEAIKALSKYYNKLTIKLDYRDEDFEMGFGFLIIRNGEILGEDYISLGKVLDNKFIIENKIVLTGSESQNEVISNVFYNNENFKCINADYSNTFKKNRDIYFFETYDEPLHTWVLNYASENDNVNLTLKYRDLLDKFYGYVIIKNSEVIYDQFINLEKEDFSPIIDYFKYPSLENFLIEKGIKEISNKESPTPSLKIKKIKKKCK